MITTTEHLCQNCESTFEPVGSQYEWTRVFCSIGCNYDYYSNQDD